MIESLRDLLAHCPPLDSLDSQALDAAAEAAVVERFRSGRLILDAFVKPATEVFVVMDGEVAVWHDPDQAEQAAEERLRRGDIFGFSAMLTESAVGPRAVAATATTVARIPAAVVAEAFTSYTGARFLARHVSQGYRRPIVPPSYLVVDDLIGAKPLVVDPGTPVSQVARLMTEQRWPCAAVRVGPREYGLVTESTLLRQVVVEGRSADTPARELMQYPVPAVESGESTADALGDLIDDGTEFLLVIGRAGELLGVLDWRDFVLSSSTTGIPLRDQIRGASDIDELVQRSRRVPTMLDAVLRRGLASGRVIAAYSAIVDSIVRRAIVLVFDEHPELSTDAFTWLSLGSNGRREAVLSSDVDAAVAFSDDLSDLEQLRYRSAFAEVMAVIARAGISIDTHGVTPQRAAFARTNAQWRRAGLRWLSRAGEGEGAIMGSLLVDARPIHGDPGLPEVTSVFGDFRRHPETVRLLLDGSLAQRARLRPMRDVLRGRRSDVDIKTAALLPVVNIARWAALAAGSAELQTTKRLRAAAGSQILPTGHAERLIEVFDVLQHLRLQYQLAALEEGRPPSDVLRRDRLSRIDRGVITEAVRQIGSVQSRMDRLSGYLSNDELTAPPGA